MTSNPIEPKLIAVEGAIGAGKTSLSRLLSERYQAQLELEKDEDNPFIAKFYEDPRGLAFQTQIFFLLSRYQQYLDLAQRGLFNSVVIIDYLFQRDRIFADLNLSGHEKALYDQIYHLIVKKIPRPDLVIFLQAGEETLIERVEKRNRDYESDIDFEYVKNVNQAFNNFFFYYQDAPLLVVNTDEIDFVEKKGDLEELINKINSHKIGREYYNPLGS